MSCEVTFSGDVTGTQACNLFLCYPGGYESLLISKDGSGDPGFQLAPAIAAPGTFAVGAYAIGDLDPTQSDFSVTANGVSYRARVTPDRTPDESVAITLDKVTPPSSDPCDGSVLGAMTVSLVEISGGVVGPGRVQASVTIDP